MRGRKTKKIAKPGQKGKKRRQGEAELKSKGTKEEERTRRRIKGKRSGAGTKEEGFELNKGRTKEGRSGTKRIPKKEDPKVGGRTENGDCGDKEERKQVR